MTDSLAGHRWILVVDSPFLPPRGGGEKEHLGFVQTAVRHGLIAAMVVPADERPERYGRADDISGLRELVSPAPVLFVPRRRRAVAAIHPIRPYTVRSRPIPHGLVSDLGALAPDATGVLLYSYKAHEIAARIATGLGLPGVVRMHNLEGRYLAALAANAGGLKGRAFGLEALRVEHDERQLERAPWVSGIADISSTDAECRAVRTRTPVRYVPTFALGPAAASAWPPRQPTADPTVIFFGALYVRTHHDAVAWFAERVWPLVLEQIPQARWLIAGRQPGPGVVELAERTPRTELHADIEDVGATLASMRVAVNPAVSGSGVNIKLAEYLASGIPVVSTTKGMQGVGVTAGQDLLVEDHPEAFATAVVRLLHEREYAESLGAAGANAARRLLDVDHSLSALAELFPVPNRRAEQAMMKGGS